MIRNKKIQIAVLSLFAWTVLLGHSQRALASNAGIGPALSDSGDAAADSSVYPALSSVTTNTTRMLAFNGPGTLFGVHLASSAQTGSFVIFEDSGTSGNLNGANASNSVLTTVAFGTTTVAGAVSPTVVVQFNPPFRVRYGLYMQATACSTGVKQCATALFDQHIR